MHIRPFQALHPNLDSIPANEAFFESVKERYSALAKKGLYDQKTETALFIYQIRHALRTYTGIVACVDVEDFLQGHIRKHEHTIRAKEELQLQLFFENQAQVKPVLLTYAGIPDINSWIIAQTTQTPPFLSVDFEESKQVHEFWQISDSQRIRQVQQLFEQQVSDTYIADGHHRTSSMALLYERGEPATRPESHTTILCALFPSTDLDILDFNRVVEITHLSEQEFLEQLATVFDIKPLPKAAKPQQKHELTLFYKQQWFRLRWKQAVLDEYAHERVVLDVSLLNAKVMQAILGIEDVRKDERVTYVEGPRGIAGMEKAVAEGSNRAGFYLYPIQFDDLTMLVDAGGVLPPKSTWFEPRMKNGLLVKALE